MQRQADLLGVQDQPGLVYRVPSRSAKATKWSHSWCYILLFLLLLSLCVWVFYLNVGLCLWRALDPQNWLWRHLWATMWVLGWNHLQWTIYLSSPRSTLKLENRKEYAVTKKHRKIWIPNICHFQMTNPDKLLYLKFIYMMMLFWKLDNTSIQGHKIR